MTATIAAVAGTTYAAGFGSTATVWTLTGAEQRFFGASGAWAVSMTFPAEPVYLRHETVYVDSAPEAYSVMRARIGRNQVDPVPVAAE